MTFNPLSSARDRAFEIARSGGCRSWPEIAWRLTREGYGKDAVIALGADVSARTGLDKVLLETLGPHRAHA